MNISMKSRKLSLKEPTVRDGRSEQWWLEIIASSHPDIMVLHPATSPAWREIVAELLAPLSPEALTTLDQVRVLPFTPKGTQSFTLDGTVVTVQHFT